MAVAPGEVVFDVALGCHILAGLTGVASGATAALAAKRPGLHPRAGRVYLWAMAVVFVTATTMSLLRLARNWHLLLIALVAAGLAGAGYLARRRRLRPLTHRDRTSGCVRGRPVWLRAHMLAMGGSYIALLTGFYVDNGPNLPLWNRLPPVAFWFLPSVVGVPLLRRALARRHLRLLSGARSGPTGSGGRPGRPA